MTMMLAFSRPTANDEERQLLFRSFRSAGYNGLQLKADQYRPYLREPEKFLEEWGHVPGAASALIAGGNLDEENLSFLRSVFRFAEKAGTGLIVFCHTLPRKYVTFGDIRRFAAMLSDLGREARQRGLKLSLHHHYDQPVMYREDFDVFFEKIAGDSVGLTVDTAHLVKSGITDIAEVIHSFRNIIDNFHLKDFADGEWRILGRGGIDFQPVFAAIRSIGYNGWISADEESGGGIREAMDDCYRFIRNGLGIGPPASDTGS